MKTNLKAGDKLYAMIAPRPGKAQVLTEVLISKVGSKYIYAEGEKYKINKETLKCEDYPNRRQFYQTAQELIDLEEILQMRRQVEQTIRRWDFKATDEQIRAIHKILFPTNENKSE